jgi:hypothetical protein
MDASFKVDLPFDIGAPLLWDAQQTMGSTLPSGLALKDCEFRVARSSRLLGEVNRDVQLYLTVPGRKDPGPGYYVLGYPLDLVQNTHAVGKLPRAQRASLGELVAPFADRLRVESDKTA